MGLTTSFVGIDADAIGNGDADETLPIDTWLQRRIQYNNQRLLAPRAAICWSPISGSAGTWTSYTGIRPYCSFEWHSVWTGHVQALRDQTHIEITLAYHSDTPGNTTQAGAVYVGVWCDDGTDTRQAGGEALASTYSTGVKTGHQTITVTLAERVRTNRLMRLVIWARSDRTANVATTIGDAGTGATSTLYHDAPYTLRDSDAADPRYFSPNSTGSPPDGDSLEAMYVAGGVHPSMPDASAVRYDLLYTASVSTQGSIAGTLGGVVQSAPTVASSGTARMHQCLMLRAVFFAPVFGSVAVSYAHTAIIPAIQFAPNQEFGAAEAMKQAAAVITAYRQPTVALIGPRGRWHDIAYSESDLDPFAAQGYAAHWPTIQGYYTDVATDGRGTDLINEGFYLRTENPRLELVCQWLSVQHGAAWGQNQDALGREEKDRRSIGPKQAVVDVGTAGLAIWDMTVSVHQLTDAVSTGDWDTDITEYGSLTDTPSIPVFGVDVLGSPDAPPVVRGIDGQEQTGKGSAAGAGFWFREGSLFAEDFAAGVLYETRHTLQISDMTQAITLLPFRITVNMDLNSYVDPIKIVDTPENDLRLTLVSFTLIEHPEDP